jgi:DNA-binding transcriptional regulator YiaG
MTKTNENRARKHGQPLSDAQQFLLGLARAANYSPARLLAARLLAGYTQQEIADLVGCGVDMVRRWERGEEPNAQKLVRMMVVYAIGPNDLIAK